MRKRDNNALMNVTHIIEYILAMGQYKTGIIELAGW